MEEGAAGAGSLGTAITDLERMAEHLRELSIVVMNFRAESSDTLMKKLNEIMQSMKELANISKDGLDQVVVPFGVIGDFVDQGVNPDFYLERVVNQTIKDRGSESAKVKLFKNYHRVLHEALAARYPEEMTEYLQQEDVQY